MIVVADASPLNYLLQIRSEHLLRELYSKILVPDAVIQELQAAEAPGVVRTWAENLPDWAEVQRPSKLLAQGSVLLDRGERAAIQLALERAATILLIDELKATAVARSIGFVVIGTLGILREAHSTNLIDGYEAYKQLKKTTNFRDTEALARTYLDSLTKRV